MGDPRKTIIKKQATHKAGDDGFEVLQPGAYEDEQLRQIGQKFQDAFSVTFARIVIFGESAIHKPDDPKDE